MSSKNMLISTMVAAVVFAGCGGSRNSREDDPVDFSPGAGEVQAAWTSSSSDIVHDGVRGALYYLDVENTAVREIRLDGGDDAELIALQFEPAKMRMTTDADSLYLLESDDSAQATDGQADIVRYSISGDYLDTSDRVELPVDLAAADFVATTDRQILVSNYEIAVTPTAQVFNLYDFYSGSLLDSVEFSGAVWPQLALNDDQQTVAAELMYTSTIHLDVLSIANGEINVIESSQLTLGDAAENTYEPAGDRLFRSNSEVWFADDADASLGRDYIAIDFDRNDDRIVTLVNSSGSTYVVQYYNSESLELLSEQTLPAIADASGMAPRRLFVDDGKLYVVYREITGSVTADWLLVQFDYP